MIKQNYVVTLLVAAVILQGAGRSYSAEPTTLEQAKVNIQSQIKAGSYDQAQAAIEKLKADFAADNNLPDALCWLAEEYRWVGKYETAKSMYQQIMQQYPAGSAGNKARLGVSKIDVLSLIKAGKTKEALDATDKLVADFAGHPDLPETLYWTAKQFEWATAEQSEWTSFDYDEAKRVYQQLIQNCPRSEFADKAQVDFKRISHRTKIFSLMNKGGDNAAIQAAIAELKDDVAVRPELPSELYWIAKGYEQYLTDYAHAKAIYEQILQQYPYSEQAGNAKLDVLRTEVLLLVESGDDKGAQAVIDNLLSNFKDNPYLPEVVQNIGHSYYTKARLTNLEGDIEGGKVFYRKAVEIWERLVSAFPDSEVAPSACYSLAVCYAQELEEYQKGIDYFQKVVNDWPNYEYVQQAKLLIGEYYKKIENNKNEK